MRKLRDLASDILYFLSKNRFTLIFSAPIIAFFLFVSLFSDSYNAKLFFFDAKEQKLYPEKRKLLKKKTKNEKIDRIVEEVLLGPVSEKYTAIFPEESRIISSWIKDKEYHLNLSEETLTRINSTSKDKKITPLIALESLILSIIKNEQSVKKVVFYFNGAEYKFIDNFNVNEKFFAN